MFRTHCFCAAAVYICMYIVGWGSNQPASDSWTRIITSRLLPHSACSSVRVLRLTPSWPKTPEKKWQKTRKEEERRNTHTRLTREIGKNRFAQRTSKYNTHTHRMGDFHIRLRHDSSVSLFLVVECIRDKTRITAIAKSHPSPPALSVVFVIFTVSRVRSADAK